jgi:hypothetical protein
MLFIKSNKKIVLIGLGNIGKHYMSGLSKVKFKADFFFIDCSTNNLNKAEKQWLSICKKETLANFTKKINILPKKIDLVIIATPANSRLKIIEKLKNLSKVRYWIVEKPLTVDSKSLNKICKYLKNQRVFINISRVYSKNYLKIKKKILSRNNLKLKVNGFCWNLAGNAIHFLYLYFWLKNSLAKKKLSFILDVKSKYETKRKGFFDFCGSLKVISDNEEIIFLNSQRAKENINTNLITEITNGKRKWEINENNNKFYTNGKFSGQDKNFYQSLITSKIVSNIILKNKTELPTLAQVYFLQKDLINIFEKKFSLYKKIT